MRTLPARVRKLLPKAPAARLELPADTYVGVSCWSGDRHWLLSVQVAYQAMYKHLRPSVCDVHGRGGLSLESLMRVATVMADHADIRTGRECRPAVETIAEKARVSKSVVQRARRLLILMGVATEVMRGRQRTLLERLETWRLGVKSRGWASVWSLHPPRSAQLLGMVTPHPRSGPASRKTQARNNSLAKTGCAGQTFGRASRVSSDQAGSIRKRKQAIPTREALLLASRWRNHPESPHWAFRHSPTGWARPFQKAAAAGWTPADLNQLLRDHTSAGGWIALNPDHPIKLMAWLLSEADLADRPAYYDEQRNADLARRAACKLCGEDGYRLDVDGAPVEPVVRCDHGVPSEAVDAA